MTEKFNEGCMYTALEFIQDQPKYQGGEQGQWLGNKQLNIQSGIGRFYI